MKIKGINEILGYIYFVLGAVKLMYIIVIVFKTITYIQSIFSGGNAILDIYKYETFSTILGGIELVLGAVAIVMLILNITKGTQVILPYLLNIFAVLIQFSPILTFWLTVSACGIYMKQGSRIVKLNKGEVTKLSRVSKQVNDTDWFYNE